jgi:hypothetical protein
VQFIRCATQEEVRLASQYRNDGRVIAELFGKFQYSELWELDRSDIGHVRVSVHYPTRDTKGSLQDLYANWLRWIEGPSDEAMVDKAVYRGFVEALREGRTPPTPILQGVWEVHDGRHRFLAMYEVSAERPEIGAKAYWVHAWPDGILAHLVEATRARRDQAGGSLVAERAGFE